MRRHAMQSHILQKKSAKRKRLFSGERAVSAADVKQVLKNAPTLKK